ncbi:MAG: tail fiber domain-containing protein [Alphaproteobacteria bacterium]|nr:tail fiber domain-containing protein [Alphaproteobacteria bacterium]
MAKKYFPVFIVLMAVLGSTRPALAVTDGITSTAAGNVGLYTGGTEALHIDSSQRVGIGTASSVAPLDVYGSNGSADFAIRSSSGQLVVDAYNNNVNYIESFNGAGTASQPLWFTGASSTATTFQFVGDVGINVVADAYPGSLSSLSIYYTGAGTQFGIALKPAADSTRAIDFLNAAGAHVGYIGETSSGVTYNNLSDRRLKEHIAPTVRGLAELAKIPVSDFNFIADPAKKRMQGFIAQDLYEIYPEAVTVGGDDPKQQPWAVDYGRLTPLLVKAIQELKTDNDDLRARVAALETKP